MTAFEPRNPGYAQRVRQTFADQGFMETLGARFESVAPGEVVLSLAFADTLTQHHGFFHGGVIGTLADNTAGFASYSLVSAEQSILTVEYKLSLLAPGEGSRLWARGWVLRPGRTIIHARSEVEVERDGKRYPCATALVTLMAVELGS